MSELKTTTARPSISLLGYTFLTFDEMIEKALDDLENTSNPLLQQMNSRVDEIQDIMKESMQVPHLMQFMSMSIMFPIFGISLFMLGGPLYLTGIFSMAGPLYLMGFLQDKTVQRETTQNFNIDDNGRNWAK